jgi:hypothetical protein
MPEARSSAESLVFRAISAERAPSRADRQELPSLDLVGAAIARAARLAAAEDRTRSAYALLQLRKRGRAQGTGLEDEQALFLQLQALDPRHASYYRYTARQH